MINMLDNPPEKHYGVLREAPLGDAMGAQAEEIFRDGFCIIDSLLTAEEKKGLSNAYDSMERNYKKKFGGHLSRRPEEKDIFRLPMAFETNFIDLAFNAQLHSFIGQILEGQYILNQQNAITNPAGRGYSQGRWHRDLPYQHFTVSKPIGLNALYCIDEFNRENGATWVIPGSHLHEDFPSYGYRSSRAKKICAPAGSFIVMDVMTFHSGGWNNSAKNRRAVNHVFTIPYIRQQIDISAAMETTALSCWQKEILGIKHSHSRGVEEFIARGS